MDSRCGSVVALPLELLSTIFSQIPPSSLTAVCLTCHAFRNVAAGILYKNLYLPWNFMSGLKLPVIENVMTSSDFALSKIKRLEIVPDNSVYPGILRNPSNRGLKGAEDLLLRLILHRLQPGQLRSVSLSLAGGISTETAVFLMKTQPNLKHIDLSTNTRPREPGYGDLLSCKSVSSGIESFGFYIGRFEEAVSIPFAFIHNVLRDNCRTLKSLYISFDKKSELFNELENDLMNPQIDQTLTARILQHFARSPNNEKELIEFPSLNQLRIRSFPKFSAICKLANPPLLSRFHWSNIKTLRIDDCSGADGLLLDIAGKMPNLRVLQIQMSCSWDTLEEILPKLAPLEVLHVIFSVDGEAPGETAFEVLNSHRHTLRSLWIEYDSDHRLMDDAISHIISTGPHPLCQRHWPKLEQLSLQLIDDYAVFYPMENLRYLRILHPPDFDHRSLEHETKLVKQLCESLLQATLRDGRLPTLQVVAVMVYDQVPKNPHTALFPAYFVVEFVKTLLGDWTVLLSPGSHHDIRRLFPDITMMEFERGERLWDSNDGRILS
ncbi:hypothetical protein H072_4270 [Dactylellina haptotyla CBS 200.50]|uniref:F-box domain-containing protein n=1 Tax=Dactylellina haptotyla (strain CBS 200.50) TaxID=1284197 RepID=S8AFF4_DACHA|nr:hypothetical protein H072_4270 [Dactylellina haptotyla CBS 200.50]